MVIRTEWVCNHTSDNKMATTCIGSPICLSQLQLPRKEEEPSYERKGKFALKDWQRSGKLLGIETKVVIGWFKPQLWMWLLDSNFNFECDWLIKLSDKKLSNNKLSDKNWTSELVEKRSFFKSITIEEIVILMIKWYEG